MANGSRELSDALAARSIPEPDRSRIRALWSRGSAHWPALAGDPDVFVALVARLLGEDDALDLEDHAEGVFVVAACTTGARVAISAFERQYFGVIDQAIARFRLDDGDRDEVRQEVRRRLFVSTDGGPPPIVRYIGRGSLPGLLRVVAVRVALTIVDGSTPVPATELEHQPLEDALDDPELRLLKVRSREALREAFAHALTLLEPQQRNLLRFHLVDGLDIDQLGVLYDVHRSTAARRLERARSDVAAHTRTRLEEQLDLDPEQLQSLLRLARSKLELSVSRLLRPD